MPPIVLQQPSSTLRWSKGKLHMNPEWQLNRDDAIGLCMSIYDKYTVDEKGIIAGLQQQATMVQYLASTIFREMQHPAFDPRIGIFEISTSKFEMDAGVFVQSESGQYKRFDDKVHGDPKWFLDKDYQCLFEREHKNLPVHRWTCKVYKLPYPLTTLPDSCIVGNFAISFKAV